MSNCSNVLGIMSSNIGIYFTVAAHTYAAAAPIAAHHAYAAAPVVAHAAPVAVAAKH